MLLSMVVLVFIEIEIETSKCYSLIINRFRNGHITVIFFNSYPVPYPDFRVWYPEIRLWFLQTIAPHKSEKREKYFVIFYYLTIT